MRVEGVAVEKQMPRGHDNKRGKSKGKGAPPFRKSAKGWGTRGLWGYLAGVAGAAAAAGGGLKSFTTLRPDL
jgi:hypothetical protein